MDVVLEVSNERTATSTKNKTDKLPYFTKNKTDYGVYPA